MRSFIVDTRMFNQPGFEVLYDAWRDVFEVDDDGKPNLDAEKAVEKTILARREVIETTGLDQSTVTTLENIACRYAQVMPVFLEERLYV